MKRIIVPTNFSEVAWSAAVYALEYCVFFNLKLQLVHVYEQSSNDLNANPTDISSTMDEEENKMKDLLGKIKQMDRYNAIEVKSSCVAGSLVHNLQAIVSQNEGDLLVIGTQGKSGAIGRLFGSNASRIIREMNCPTLVIPFGFQFSSSTPVVCALDHGTVVHEFDMSVLEQLVNTSPEEALKVIHIINDAKDLENPVQLDQFKNIKLKYDEIVGDNISTLLERYSHINNSRMLVLIKKEKGFFERFFKGSVLNDLTINAKVPLLILNEDTNK